MSKERKKPQAKAEETDRNTTIGINSLNDPTTNAAERLLRKMKAGGGAAEFDTVVVRECTCWTMKSLRDWLRKACDEIDCLREQANGHC